MMSPRGSIMASFEDVESFLAVHTPSGFNYLQYLKQEGVSSKSVFESLKNFFSAGTTSFDHKIPYGICIFGNHRAIIINHERKVVGGEIFCSFFITDNDIKFLEQQNPPEQSWLSILLSKQCNVLDSVIVLLAYVSDEVLGLKFAPRNDPNSKIIASQMISKESNRGATRIG
ncbi:hypothetical protein Tco_0506363 [Tanacetum coccineum]